MPLARIPADQALRNLRSSRSCRYPDDRTGSLRLAEIAEIESRPSFTFSKDDHVLTVGSCFARELEARLSSHGFELPMRRLTLGAGRLQDEGYLNKYVVQSIENELRWAAGEPPPPPERLFLEQEEGLWCDPQMVVREGAEPLETVIARRRWMTEAYARMASCRIIILTLGLAEAWFDHETSLYLNVAPPSLAMRRQPDRFSLDVLDHDDVLGGLERIYAIFERAGHPDFRMIVTVSPVPFKATFTGEDALVANFYGKSVQRAASQAFAARHDRVDYFPSLEMVALSSRELVYEKDNVHVSRPMVERIMDTALSRYAPELKVRAAAVVRTPRSRGAEAQMPLADQISLAGRLIEEGNFGSAVATCEAVLGAPDLTHGLKGQALGMQALALMKLQSWNEAIERLQRAIEAAPNDATAHFRLGHCYGALRQRARALAAYERAVAISPSHPGYRQKLKVERARAGPFGGLGLAVARWRRRLLSGEGGRLVPASGRDA